MAPTKRAMPGDVASSSEARSPQRLGVLAIEVADGADLRLDLDPMDSEV